MKKRVVLILLSGILCTGGGVLQAYAGSDMSLDESGYVRTITPNYANINSIRNSFSISGSNANYNSTVTSKNATKIKIYLELQKKTSSGWTKVKSSSGYANKSSYAYSDTASIDKSGTYRAFYSVTAYYGGGESETVTEYKY